MEGHRRPARFRLSGISCGLVMLIAALAAVPIWTSSAEPDPSAPAMTSVEIFQRAEDLADAEKFREAAYFFRRYLQDDPADPAAVVGLARCVAELEGSEAARPHFLRVVELDPGNQLARGWLEEHTPKPEVAPARPAPVREPVESTTQGEAVENGEPGREVAPPPVSASGLTPEESRQQQSVEEEPAPSSPPPTAEDQPGDLVAASSEAVEVASDVVAAGPSRRGSLLLGGIAAMGIVVACLAAFVSWRRRASCTVRGRIEKFPLADLLQWLSIGGKEGRVRVAARAGAGQILVKEGRLYRADFGAAAGTDAAFKLLSLEQGRFVFREMVLPAKVGSNIDVPVPQILMRWACATDEARRDSLADDDAEGRSADPAVDLETLADSDLNIDLPF